MRVIGADEPGTFEPHAVALKTEAWSLLEEPFEPIVDAELGSLTRALWLAGAKLQWRNLAAPGAAPSKPPAHVHFATPVKRPTHRRESERGEERKRLVTPPVLPGVDQACIRRWTFAHAWMPPETLPLCRHREVGGERRIVTNDRVPPEGYSLEWDLGSIRVSSLQGTTPLRVDDDTTTYSTGAGSEGRLVGHLETAPLPLFEGVHVGRFAATGQEVLVSGAEDPLAPGVEALRFAGFIEQFPVPPRRPPHAERLHGLRGLLRAADYGRRRHVHAVGAVPDGERVGELGAVLDLPQPDAIPLWVLPDGRVATDSYRPLRDRPGARAAGRWTVAPATWETVAFAKQRARAVGRRAVDAARAMRNGSGPAATPSGAPAGWLLAEQADGTVPLYAAMHPVTGDQVLTRYPMEVGDMGYEDVRLLGWMVEVAPVTGSLDLTPTAAPWASRFGQQVRMR
jgi:hypothetical protein